MEPIIYPSTRSDCRDSSSFRTMWSMTASRTTRTWTFTIHAVPADLMQASAVIASVVYHAANRPELLPRKELPPPVKLKN